MTYPMPRDTVFLDPSGAVTATPGEAYRNEHDESEEFYEEVAHVQDAQESGEGEAEARDEEARAAEGDQDDDAATHDPEADAAAPADDDDDDDDDDDVSATAGGMRPGDADLSVTAASPASSADFRDRWQQVQLSFIDDPRAAAENARTLASEVLEAHVSALRDRQEQLDAWHSEAAGDTEVWRAAMRAYRDMITSLTEE